MIPTQEVQDALARKGKNIHEIEEFLPPSGSFTKEELKYLGRTKTEYDYMKALKTGTMLAVIITILHFLVIPEYIKFITN